MKHSKKTCIVGDSHIRRIKKNLFNNSITGGKAHLNNFSGANINRLDHFISPNLEEDRADIITIHVGLNYKRIIQSIILTQKASQNVL